MTKYARSILYQVYSNTLFKKSAKNVNNNLNIKIMIPALIEAAGVIGGAVLGNQARQQQTNEEYQKMMYQGNINKDLANHTMKNQKELWDYTNYPNQVKQMKLAGLNPALMYGTAGQGGQSSAGQTGPVGLSDSKGVAMQQQQMAMGLQLAQIASQIKVNDSVAEKNKAEAEKTAGVDTEAAKAGIILSQAQALTERERKSVLHWEGELTQSKQVLTEALANTEQFNLQKVQWDLRMMEKSYEELSENVIRLKRENRIGDETAETQIQQYKADLIKTWQEVALKVAQTETQREEVKAIAKRLEQKDYELEQNDTKITQEWVGLGIKGAAELGDLLIGIKKLSKLSKIFK